MFGWSLIFLAVLLVAGLAGFSGIAGGAVGLAKMVFVICSALFVGTLIVGRRRA